MSDDHAEEATERDVRQDVHHDIRPLLDAWDDDEIPVRRTRGADGRPILQRRLPLGVLQFEAEGRPDGQKPHNFESFFAYFRARCASRPQRGLSHEECLQLANESLLYYQRRLCHFELNDYEAAAADAARNLEVFALVREHANQEEDKWMLDQYRGFVIHHRSRAEALAALEVEDYDASLAALDRGVEEIRAFYREHDAEEQVDQSDELEMLGQMREKIDGLRPKGPLETLNAELQAAVQAEQYEQAARLRDRIAELQPHADA